jgi:hypothetical protein
VKRTDWKERKEREGLFESGEREKERQSGTCPVLVLLGTRYAGSTYRDDLG